MWQVFPDLHGQENKLGFSKKTVTSQKECHLHVLVCGKHLLFLTLDSNGTSLSIAPHYGNFGAGTVGTEGLTEQVTQQNVRLVR